MLLMVEKGIRGGICYAIHRSAKANNKYIKNYNKNIISSYLIYLDANNLYGQAMSQKPPVNGFVWAEELSHFNEDLTAKYDENSNEAYFLEVDVEYPQNCLIFIVIFLFYIKEKKAENVISLFVTYMTKKTMLFT